MKIQSAKAGIGTGRAGLQAASGLFSSAGLFDKGVKSFNPLDLDPYLLFDAETSMIGTLENPTLDLDPSKQDTLDVITATRAGTATFTDANGNIASAPANTVRVDQTQGAELTPTKFQRVGYTDFSQGWTQQNATITLGAATAPDGTETAIKITEASASSSTYDVRHTISGGNNTFTHSLYAKQADANRHLYFEIGNTRVGVNLETGAVFYSANNFLTGWSNASVSVVSVGNGWFRVSLTATASSSVTSFKSKIHVATLTGGAGGIVYNGDGTSGIFIWGPQVEEGTTASDFVANTTGSPKFITGATFGPRVPMILVEPSATNLLPYSEDLGQWSESINGSGVSPVLTSDQEIAPNGLQEADKIVFNLGGGTSTGDLTSLFISPSLSGQPYAGSIYLKGENGGEVILFRTVTGGYTELTLTTDWQRFESIETYVSGTRRFEIGLRGGIVSGGINNTATIYAWGAQLETGSVATSYIPTSGSTAQRAADDLVISGSDFSDFFNSGGDGTFYAEFTTRSITGAQVYVLAGHTSAQRYMYKNPQNTYFLAFDGVAPFLIYGDPQTTLNRASISYNATHKEGSLNGSTVSNVTSTGVLRDATKLNIGQDYNSSKQLNGHIKRLIYWPYHSDSL